MFSMAMLSQSIHLSDLCIFELHHYGGMVVHTTHPMNIHTTFTELASITYANALDTQDTHRCEINLT